MSLSKRFLLLGSILLMAALVFTFSPTTPSAHAASVSASPHVLTMPTSPNSPDFRCPSRTICFFQYDNFTGKYFYCATDVCRGGWFPTTIGGVHAGSVNDNSNSVFLLLDRQRSPYPICVYPGRYVIFHQYGYFRVLYGVTHC